MDRIPEAAPIDLDSMTEEQEDALLLEIALERLRQPRGPLISVDDLPE